MPRFSPDTDNYMLGRGKLYISRLDENGLHQGEIDIGNVTAFSLTPTVEKLEHFSSQSETRDKDKVVVTTTSFAGKITLDEISRENLKFALFSDAGEASYTQATGHQVNESIKGYLGKWTKLSKRNVAVLSVTNETGLTHFIEGTDYSVDTASGRVKAIVGGSISEAQTLLVDYTYDSASYPKLSAFDVTETEVFIRFVGTSAVGPKYELEIWKAKITPSGDISLITENDWNKLEFELEILKDVAGHPTEPWFALYDITTNESQVS